MKSKRIIEYFFYGNLNQHEVKNFQGYILKKKKIFFLSNINLIFMVLLCYSSIIILLIPFYYNYKNNLLLLSILPWIIIKGIYEVLKYQWKAHIASINAYGFLALNELLVILETTRSLQQASIFVSRSHYPIFSQMFKKALMESHFGVPLTTSLVREAEINLDGEMKNNFLLIINNWTHGFSLLKRIKHKLSERITNTLLKEYEKIDSWYSLSSGFIYLSPPVLVFLLLISGNLSYFNGFIIIIGIIFLSFLFSPTKFIFSLDNRNLVFSDKSSQIIDFMITFGERLAKGENFNKGLINSIKSFPSIDAKINLQNNNNFDFKVWNIDYNKLEKVLQPVLTERFFYLLQITKKFAEIDNKLAGIKLTEIILEISSIQELIGKIHSRINAEQFRQSIIKTVSIFSLGIISAISPLFSIMSHLIRNDNVVNLSIPHQSGFEILFLIIATVLVLLPFSINTTDVSRKKFIFNEVIIKIPFLLVFLSTFILGRIFYSNLF